MSVEDLDIINAALTRTGEETINSLDDGSPAAEVASANYEMIAKAALTKYPWSWAIESAALDLLQGTPINGWGYQFSKPSSALKVWAVKCQGAPIYYQQRRNKIYTDSNDDLVADFTERVAEEFWSDDFVEAITQKMEALFLRALAEKHEEASARDDEAIVSLRLAYNNDAKNKTPRDKRASRLVNVRG